MVALPAHGCLLGIGCSSHYARSHRQRTESPDGRCRADAGRRLSMCAISACARAGALPRWCRAASCRAAPREEIGKNISGSADWHAASEHQSGRTSVAAMSTPRHVPLNHRYGRAGSRVRSWLPSTKPVYSSRHKKPVCQIAHAGPRRRRRRPMSRSVYPACARRRPGSRTDVPPAGCGWRR